jgi:hypothetical protein
LGEVQPSPPLVGVFSFLEEIFFDTEDMKWDEDAYVDTIANSPEEVQVGTVAFLEVIVRTVLYVRTIR